MKQSLDKTSFYWSFPPLGWILRLFEFRITENVTILNWLARRVMLVVSKHWHLQAWGHWPRRGLSQSVYSWSWNEYTMSPNVSKHFGSAVNIFRGFLGIYNAYIYCWCGEINKYSKDCSILHLSDIPSVEIVRYKEILTGLHFTGRAYW